MNTIVYLNGKFIPKEKARISPDDRGFYFADGIYEVIKYYRGKAFRFRDHMTRLKRSLAGIRIGFTGIDQLEETGHEIIRLNRMEKEYTGVYLQVTRGVHQRMHRFPEAVTKPTVYMNAYPLPPFINEFVQGIRVILREDIRWHRCDIKSIMLLPNVLLFQEAVENNARECFFIRDGCFTESTHSNIFGVKSGVIYTYPDSNRILPGITKKVIFQICNRIGITITETPVKADDFRNYDEFFISGTGSEVMPVIQLEDTTVRDGKPGPLTRRIQQEFFRETYGEMADDWDFRGWM
jgi:D-alanine transaminase